MPRSILSQVERARRAMSPKSGSPGYTSDAPRSPVPEYFVPPGYVPLLRAVYLLAKRNNEVAWTNNIHQSEQELYEGLGSSHDVEHLRAQVKKSASRKRFSGYRLDLLDKAATKVRIGLALADLPSVEHIRANGERQAIAPTFWNSDAAAKILVTGKSYRVMGLDHCETRILIPHEELIRWMEARSNSATDSPTPENADIGVAQEATASAAPAKPAQADVDQGPVGTGLAGRPTSIQLILQEADRRCNLGDVPEHKIVFAEELSEWLAKNHPTHPKATPKAIGNNKNFTSLFRRFGARPKSKP